MEFTCPVRWVCFRKGKHRRVSAGSSLGKEAAAEEGGRCEGDRLLRSPLAGHSFSARSYHEANRMFFWLSCRRPSAVVSLRNLWETLRRRCSGKYKDVSRWVSLEAVKRWQRQDWRHAEGKPEKHSPAGCQVPATLRHCDAATSRSDPLSHSAPHSVRVEGSWHSWPAL